ncbi:antirestriction protein [Paenibacillus phage SV21]|nr:antirestriction protein [Paenibacillus phage SV21]
MNNKFTIRVYVVDLAAYSNGLLRGEWITLPTTKKELGEVLRFTTNGGENDYAIHGYEAPFAIGEYTSLTKLNDIMEVLSNKFEGVDHDIIQALADRLDSNEELVDVEYIVYYADDLIDLGYELVESSGLDITDDVESYFDYEWYARDMVLNGNFVEGNGFYVEIIG